MRFTTALAATALLFAGSAQADDNHHHHKSNQACPVESLNPTLYPNPATAIDDEFGPGVGALTTCNEKRHNVKIVFQLNASQVVPPATTTSPALNCYGLGNITNVIDDYEITHGMTRGRDYQIAAIVHSAGGPMLVKNGVNGKPNGCQAQVEALIAKGVKFYFCQNTTRAFLSNGRLTAGSVKEQVIDGVEYVTAGLGALADFQSRGWKYVQP
jgi:intracellular sulfur oxidation DsrE/DsrF family protein